MGLSYYAHRIVSQTMWSVLGIRVDGLSLRLYLVYLLRDTLPSVDFELCSQSSSGIIESDFSV